MNEQGGTLRAERWAWSMNAILSYVTTTPFPLVRGVPSAERKRFHP